MDNDYLIFLDGGCKANPGRLAVAAVVCGPEGEKLAELARHAGKGTSNVAEYRALAHAIFMAKLFGARRPMFVCDSLLVVQQVNGFWAMRGDPGSPMQLAHAHAVSELMTFDRWLLKHIPREKNKRADWLVCTLLEHDRALKKAPEVATVPCDGDGRPGWAEL